MATNDSRKWIAGRSYRDAIRSTLMADYKVTTRQATRMMRREQRLVESGWLMGNSAVQTADRIAYQDLGHHILR